MNLTRWRNPWVEQDPRTKTWNLRWIERDTDGVLRRRSLKCADHSDACTQRDNKRDELKLRREGSSDPGADLAKLYEKYMREKEHIKLLRPRALLCKRQALDRYVKLTKTVGGITRDTLIEYRDNLLDSLAPVTVGIRMSEIKAFVRWLWREGKLSTEPFAKGIELPRREPSPRFLTDDELQKLESVCRGDMRAIVRMGYLTGMRRNEILSARWEDVSWVSGSAFLTILSVTAKNRRARTIKLHQGVLQLLHPKKKGRIFEGWDNWNLRWAWDVARKAAGFEDRVRFHDLRHTFCKLYLQGGGTIADLMKNTGHQSLPMVQVYAHFEVRYKAAQMDSIRLPFDFTVQTTVQLQDSTGNLHEIQGNKAKRSETKDDGHDDESGGQLCAI